jgi:hypothetical protein
MAIKYKDWDDYLANRPAPKKLGAPKKPPGTPPTRQPKKLEEEEKLVQRLKQFDEAAFRALRIGLATNQFAFVKLFFEYRFGKPTENIDMTSQGEKIDAVQIFKLPDNDRSEN